MGRRLWQWISDNWQIVAITLIAGFVMILRLGRDEFLDWDECIFAQQAKEMVQHNSFLTNHWNGIALFEKPPLTNWIIAMFYKGGVSEFSARLGAVVASLLILLFIYLIGKKLFNSRVGYIAALIELSAASYITYSIRINSDIFFTLFALMGYYCFVGEKPKKQYGIVSGIFYGLAVMSKGLSIFPYMFVLLLLSFLPPDRKKFFEYIKLIGAFCLVVLPWHVYHFVVYGKTFYQVYIVEHLIRRSRFPIDFHVEGRLFYLKLISQNYSLFLIFLIIPAFILFMNFKSVWTGKNIERFLNKYRILIGLYLMVCIALVSITMVRTRIWWYVLPIFPYIALIIGVGIDRFISFFPKKISRYIHFVLIVFIVGNISMTVDKEINPLSSAHPLSNRNAIFSSASKYPQSTITYLVWFSERQGRSVLPENLHTSTTFVFGGNPCAVYYSKKHIDYVYSIEEFKKELKAKNGLFALENGDWWVVKGMPVRVLERNQDYTLFSY